jgi:NADPH2:quinone reductase
MQPIPSIMKALMADASGTAEGLHLASVPTPQPGDHEVLIKVAAAGINRADILQRQGKYAPPEGVTNILGLEAAGEVVDLGRGATRFKVGDKVMALLAGGGCAEYVHVHEDHCLAVPENLSLIEAAVFPEALVTVWANVFETGRLDSYEHILIHGGASGIGTTAIQMVKAHGAYCIVTVGNDEKAEACRQLGADLAINYNEEDFVEAVLKRTGHGVNIVLDMVGGDYIPRNLKALMPGGMHISIATQHGAKAEVDFRMVMAKRLRITGSTIRARDSYEKSLLVRAVSKYAMPWVEKGEVKPVIFQAFPLEKAGEAHKVMETSAHIGKIALTV